MNEIEATRAKLKCLEMVEGTGLDWWQVVKVRVRSGNRIDIFIPLFSFDFTYNEIATYIFALGVVEGKPVWEGDTLWRTDLVNKKTTITKENFISLQSYLSWNPPKPATLMVELPIGDVESLSKGNGTTLNGYSTIIHACRKALKEMK